MLILTEPIHFSYYLSVVESKRFVEEKKKINEINER